MKDLSWSLLAAACLLTGILGNLHIPKPVIVCSGIGKNCLRGQYCDVDNRFVISPWCLMDADRRARRCHNPSLDILFGRSSLHKRAPGDPSLDGRCGPQNGGLICAPNSAVYVVCKPLFALSEDARNLLTQLHRGHAARYFFSIHACSFASFNSRDRLPVGVEILPLIVEKGALQDAHLPRRQRTHHLEVPHDRTAGAGETMEVHHVRPEVPLEVAAANSGK